MAPPKKKKAVRSKAKQKKAVKRVETRVAELVEPDDENALADFGPEDLTADADIHIPEIIDPLDGDITADLSQLTQAARGKAVSPSGSTTDPVALYLSEIRRYPLLTKEQEHDLAIRYRESGDSKAAETLVTSNLRFVVKVAAEYSKFGAKLIDLIQEGNVGLMHAVKEFNPYKGNRLITYAVWWIRGYIQEYLMRQYSMVRIGTTQSQRKLFYRLQKEKDLLDSMGTEPTTALLSSRLGVSEADVQTMTQRMSGRDVSLNQPLDSQSGSSGSSLIDFESGSALGADEELGHAEEIDVLRENIESLRGKLNEKEKYILENRILSDEPMTLQEIGDHYKVTREAVRQIEARLIGRIKTAFNERIVPHAHDNVHDDTRSGDSDSDSE